MQTMIRVRISNSQKNVISCRFSNNFVSGSGERHLLEEKHLGDTRTNTTYYILFTVFEPPYGYNEVPKHSRDLR